MHYIDLNPEKINFNLAVLEKEIVQLEGSTVIAAQSHKMVTGTGLDRWNDGFLDGLAVNHRSDANTFAFLFRINARLHEYEQAIYNEEVSKKYLDDVKSMLDRTEKIRRQLDYLEELRKRCLD